MLTNNDYAIYQQFVTVKWLSEVFVVDNDIKVPDIKVYLI